MTPPPPPDRRRGRKAGGGREQLGSEARRAVARGRTKRTEHTKHAERTERAPRSEPEVRTPKSWGGVARRGARVVGEPRAGTASAAWREAVARGRKDADHGRTTPPPTWEPEIWVEEKPGNGDHAAAPPRTTAARTAGTRTTRGRRGLPPDVTSELARAVGPARVGRSGRLEATLAEATRAYERDRYQDARRLLKPLAERVAPGAAAVRELYGLTLYRMGKWAEAIKELEAFRSLTGSYDQHPVLADCHRALRQWSKVEALWEELRAASPGAQVVAEGRIVVAGALGDRGDVRGAIRLLERARLDAKRPKVHHLRIRYALADLYERAGEIPRARELFREILAQDHDFADTAERLAALD